MAKKSKQQDCPCGTGNDYQACCGQYVEGRAIAPTAETLMRSRYSAYVLKKSDYLLSSWHETKRPASLELDNDPAKWVGLKVVQTELGQASDDKGTVEFIARFKLNGKAEHLHETSRFIKENQHWYYVDGKLH